MAHRMLLFICKPIFLLPLRIFASHSYSLPFSQSQSLLPPLTTTPYSLPFSQSKSLLPPLTTATRNRINNRLWCSTTVDATTEDVSKRYLELTDDELMRQCEMGTFRTSGPGGQHRNKRDTAVRLKHLPTGIVAQASEDRSQHKNRASALKRLRARIALKRRQWILKLIRHQGSFFRYFLPSHPLEVQIVVHKLDPITPSFCWECKLYWISFLQLRVPSQMLQNILG
nr:uncharacterized protein LOC112801776 isoform X3 [Arachis hypogaea]